MDFSAGYYFAISRTGSPFYYLKNSFMWACIGWVVFFICSKFDYHHFRVLSLIGIIVSMGLLVLVLTSFGVSYNNAARWIEIGPITLMPGEIAKTCIILFFASVFGADPKRVRDWRYILSALAILGIIFVMIYKQPNLSTAATAVIIGLGIMFVAGLPWKLIIVCGGGACALLAVLLITKGGYMLSRITSFLDPWADALGSGYQVCQGLLALGSGGVFGVGIGNSVQKAYYLPEAESDFILPIIGEELGFVGVLVLVIVYMGLTYAIFSISMRAKDSLGCLLAAGVGIHLAVQVILNIAIVTATFPPTGIALPLISMGGNSTLMFMMELGIVYNISTQAKELKAVEV